MLEKIHIQFQSFLGDPSYYDQHDLQVALIRTFGKIGPHSEPRFRDDCKFKNYTPYAMYLTTCKQIHDSVPQLWLFNYEIDDELRDFIEW